MGCCQDEELLLVQNISDMYEKISSLDNLKPSKDVDTLFTQLVHTCIPPNPIDVTKLASKFQEMRSNLIKLCGQAEGHLETHFSTILSSSFENPLNHLQIFPYFSNYLKLGLLEFTILSRHITQVPTRVAFIGSGPLPLTSIVLASNHLTTTCFHNYDVDPSANLMASRLVGSDPDMSKRMFFHTNDIMDVTNSLKEYEVVFLAALVGMDKEEKVKIIDHLSEFMAPGAILMLRSAHGARAFLYPVVDPIDLRGFEVLSVFHPTDEVINSVVIARKYHHPVTISNCHSLDHDSYHHHQGIIGSSMILPCKCSDQLTSFKPLNMIEELAVEEHLS